MKKVDQLLNSYFDEIKLKEGMEYNEFHKSWEKIAGKKISLNSKIADVIDGNLIIEIDHPGVKQLILLKKRNIIKTIQRKFPQLNVMEIKFNFKNVKSKTVKVNIEEKNSNSSIYLEQIDNKDFSELLKKMSKRSEE